MTTRTVAVVGGGVAGVSAALASSAHGAETTLVDSSRKIGVSKALMPLLLSEGWAEEDLVLPDARTLAVAGVESRTGETVSSIRRRGGKIRVEPSSRRGTEVEFDSLVVCTGATSQAPQLRGISKPNVFILKEPTDYVRLSEGLDDLETVVVSGPVPLALKIGEILATREKRVQVYCGKEGLELQFSAPIAAAIRRGASSGERGGRVLLVDSAVDSILGVARAEAIASGGSVRTCDAVVVIPGSAPSFPLVDCQKGRGGGLLVDSSMSTSQLGVFAAGDCAEIKFKSGSVPARLYSTSRMGGSVAGTNAAGGIASAAPSWAVEQSYFGLEFCSAGLGEEEALAIGLEAATATETSTSGDARFNGEVKRETFVSMVYDRGTHQVYGLQVAGWHASSLSSAASLIVSLGITVEQLVHVESPYSPKSSFEESPIALTAAKICNEEGA